MKGRKTSLATARGQLDERARLERDVRAEYVVGPVDNGFWLVHSPIDDSTRVVASGQGNTSYRPGSAVLTGMMGTADERRTILSLPPAGMQGAANFAFPAPTGAQHDIYNVVSANPATLANGAYAVPVIFQGFGFNESPVDEFRPVIYNTGTRAWDTDPLVTLGAVTWISFSRVSIPVTVAYTCPAGHEIRLEVLRA